MKRIIVVTTPKLHGRTIKRTLGLVRGNAVRARHVGKDIMARLRNIVGGEITEYTKLMAETRENALGRMLTEAEALGADAVVCTQFSTSMITDRAAELLAVGTAVELEPE